MKLRNWSMLLAIYFMALSNWHGFFVAFGFALLLALMTPSDEK